VPTTTGPRGPRADAAIRALPSAGAFIFIIDDPGFTVAARRLHPDLTSIHVTG
jgi:hypothetical protein